MPAAATYHRNEAFPLVKRICRCVQNGPTIILVSVRHKSIYFWRRYGQIFTFSFAVTFTPQIYSHSYSSPAARYASTKLEVSAAFLFPISPHGTRGRMDRETDRRTGATLNACGSYGGPHNKRTVLCVCVVKSSCPRD